MIRPDQVPHILAWFLSVLVVHYHAKSNCFVDFLRNKPNEPVVQEIKEADGPSKEVIYNRAMPIIFVGGMPRSGTTLMRSMLDAHPMVRCGEETRVVPRMIQMRSAWYRSEKESKRLDEAGVTRNVVDSAVAEFLLEIMTKHGKPAERLCNKDPFTAKYAPYLREIFPGSKHILMIRDGRSVAHSIITHNVTISGYDLKSYKDVIGRWSKAVEVMRESCKRVGRDNCLEVRYENLILHPRSSLQKIGEFLELPWHENMMEHQKHMEDISLSATEKSTNQVIKPLYTESLKAWVGHIPEDVLKELDTIAPMLSKLGYDANSTDPVFPEPDEEVTAKYKKWLAEQNSDFDAQHVEVDHADFEVPHAI